MAFMYHLDSIIRASFEKFKDRVALSQDGVPMTFAELDRRANQVAQLLDKESPAESFVGVSSTVTIDTVAAVIGILRAGRAYVPLDVLSPPERLRGIISDANLRTILIDPVAYPEWTALGGGALAKVMILGTPPPTTDRPQGVEVLPWSRCLEAPDVPVAPRLELADDLAYILYTSGSTGVPKGVMLTHRNAITFVDWMGKEFEISPSDRVAARSPLNFDFSVFDIFNSILGGATLVMTDVRKGTTAALSSAERHSAYVAMLRRERATVLYATPSNLTVLLEKGGLGPDIPLRVVMYAGEPFHPAMLSRFMHAMPRTRVANIYGPTETNIITCYWVDEPPTAPVPIGREVDDTEIIVVDDGRRCEIGEVGELWCRGGTVCVGYLGKPELTTARLVDSPFHPYPVRFWRTGDLGKRLPDGNIAYLGRIDDMVKTRGYRVEIGDVESALARSEKVRQAIVLHKPSEKYGSTLHAFILLADSASATAEQLLDELRQHVPSYMIPVDLVIVDHFPYTSTGKVDRQRLKRERLEGASA